MGAESGDHQPMTVNLSETRLVKAGVAGDSRLSRGSGTPRRPPTIRPVWTVQRVLLAGLAFNTAAYAQTAPLAPAARGETANPAPAVTNNARGGDANCDRVILSSTADTHPRGTFYVSDYELIVAQLGYAISDRVQIAVGGMPPLPVGAVPFLADLSVKANLHRGTFQLAALGAFSVLGFEGGEERGRADAVPRLGAVGQLCFDSACWSSFSANAQLLGSYYVALTGGLVLGSDGPIAALAEFDCFLAAGGGPDDATTESLYAYGLRLFGSHVAFDLTFVAMWGDNWLIGYPFLAFTYRTAGSG
jgi:hypothetical protein